MICVKHSTERYGDTKAARETITIKLMVLYELWEAAVIAVSQIYVFPRPREVRSRQVPASACNSLSPLPPGKPCPRGLPPALGSPE